MIEAAPAVSSLTDFSFTVRPAGKKAEVLKYSSEHRTVRARARRARAHLCGEHVPAACCAPPPLRACARRRLVATPLRSAPLRAP